MVLSAGSTPLPTGGLKKLEVLYFGHTQVSDAGCAALTAALGSGVLPALKTISHSLNSIPASAAAKEVVQSALAHPERWSANLY